MHAVILIVTLVAVSTLLAVLVDYTIHDDD